MIELQNLPEDPGCYLYKDESGTIIYVGKAKNLKRRVSSYFQKRDHDPKTEKLVQSIRDLDLIVTDSEVEALILENNLIKKYQPKYNIDLKDAKSYAFILIGEGKFPRISVARYRGGKKNGTLYGPFVSAAERDQILRFIKHTFRLRTCKKMPKRPCLRYHLGNCTAPCSGMVSEEEYGYLIRKADLVLKGKNQDLITDLESEMQRHADAEEYEQALQIRDQIRAIEHLSEKQNVERQKQANEHIINFLVNDGSVYLILFTIEHGMLTSKEEFVFPETEEFLEEFIIQYYATNRPPHDLILPEEPDLLIIEYLSRIRGTQVTVTVPKQGAKKKLLDLVRKNIDVSFFTGKIRLIELGEALNLDGPPEIIECFDISHLSGTGTVASMVRFHEGRPDKKNYRRFKIKNVDGIDDFASIGEVVRRRYTRLVKEEKELPDLIIIDGGLGQLRSAKTELDLLGLDIPLISIAKREEEIYSTKRNSPLSISRKSPGSLLVQEIRDEAHRFAITYQRLLRRREIL